MPTQRFVKPGNSGAGWTRRGVSTPAVHDIVSVAMQRLHGFMRRGRYSLGSAHRPSWRWICSGWTFSLRQPRSWTTPACRGQRFGYPFCKEDEW